MKALLVKGHLYYRSSVPVWSVVPQERVKVSGMADLTSDSERVQENNLVESEMIYDRNLRDWELELAYNATMKDIDLERVRAFLAQRAPSGWQVCRFKDTEY